jgi:ribonuclease VapC
LILDSSAVIAAICQEPDCERILQKIGAAEVVALGAPTVAESQLALTVKLGWEAGTLVDQFLSLAGASIVPFDRDHVAVFFDAFLRFGKGHHPARLNMGDCFTYAIAKLAGQSVLFTGNDFSQTDLDVA